jgi:hypothetical protein
MKQLLAIASAAVLASGLAVAEPVSTPKAGAHKPAAAPSKTAPAKTSKTTKKVAVIPDQSTASAPHRYPASARVLPPSRPLASGAKSQAGTVHKDAPLDQVAGAGG